MTTTASLARPRVLIVEPTFLLRQTVASVARRLDVAEPVEATTLASAERRLDQERFDALFLSLDVGDGALHLLGRLRAGGTCNAADLPVVVTASSCDTGQALTLKALDVRRILLQPFKVKDVIASLAGVVRAGAPARAAA